MNPKHWVMVKLLWPPGEDRTILTAARRCLFRAAPIELRDTGYQLLERHRLDEVKSCVQDTLADAGLGLSQVLVVLPAPAIDELTEHRYQQTFADTLELLAEELDKVSEKVLSVKLTNRLLNKSYDALDICDQFMQTPDIVLIRTYLDKLSTFPHSEQRKKGSQYVKALSTKVRKLTRETV